jgi:hypothetical protein
MYIFTMAFSFMYIRLPLVLEQQRSVFNLAPRCKTWPPGVKFTPRGEVGPPGEKLNLRDEVDTYVG